MATRTSSSFVAVLLALLGFFGCKSGEEENPIIDAGASAVEVPIDDQALEAIFTQPSPKDDDPVGTPVFRLGTRKLHDSPAAIAETVATIASWASERPMPLLPFKKGIEGLQEGNDLRRDDELGLAFGIDSEGRTARLLFLRDDMPKKAAGGEGPGSIAFRPVAFQLLAQLPGIGLPSPSHHTTAHPLDPRSMPNYRFHRTVNGVQVLGASVSVRVRDDGSIDSVQLPNVIVDTKGPPGDEKAGPTSLTTTRAVTASELRDRFQTEVRETMRPSSTLQFRDTSLVYAPVQGSDYLEPVHVFHFSTRTAGGVVTRGKTWAYRVDDPSAPKIELVLPD